MPTALAAPMIRSGFRPANNWAIAASSEPTSASDGRRTSSRKTWNWFSGLTSSISILVHVNPGVSVGTMNNAGRRLPVLASSVRPTTSTACAWSTPEMYTFWPLRTQSLPSQRAAACGHLLHHDGQLVHACAAAAVLLGQVDADEAEFACLLPQFVGVLARAGLLQVVVLAVIRGHGRH